jgi:YHS domain-containing protein
MLWKEIVLGFAIAGFIALLPMDFFNGLFVTDASRPVRLIENVVLGPIVAVLSFVCSVGNVPLAAVLWAGGISFSGVIAFVYADLIIVPIVIAYSRYYGGRAAARLVGIMFAAIVVAALVVDGLFSALGIVPSHRPSIHSITSRGIGWNYTTFLNVAFLLVAAALVALTLRRGARDPVCGMTVDRHAAKPTSVFAGRTFYFCGPGCKAKFDAEPERYVDATGRQALPLEHAGHHARR